MDRLSVRLQESFGIKDLSKKSDINLFNDLILHALVNKMSLEDTVNVLKSAFQQGYTIDLDIVKRVAQNRETIMLLDNDKPLALWARLLPAYREHLENTEENKYSQITIASDDVKNILCYGTNSSVAYKNQISKARSIINSKLPKGTILTSNSIGDNIIFSFITATSKEQAHKILVQTGSNGLHTIDKHISALGLTGE